MSKARKLPRPKNQRRPKPSVVVPHYPPGLTFDDLLELSPDALAQLDIAHASLLCATGLPNGDPDVSACLATLDRWAALCAAQTTRGWLGFLRDPAWYFNEEAAYRMMAIVTVLQRDLGLRYNPTAIGNWSFADARDSFVHGLLTGRRRGTCASMPVLYVAIGRRLGYPVHLALAKFHVFVQWVRPDGTHLNIEGAGLGMHVYGDDHYLTWPRPIDPTELKLGPFLQPLSSAEELAIFLGSRGHCLADNGRTEEAVTCYARAAALTPDSPYYESYLRATQNSLRQFHPVSANEFAFSLTRSQPFATVEGIAVGFRPMALLPFTQGVQP